MTTHRDDLDAAQQRTEALERELAQLRERNQKLETDLARDVSPEHVAALVRKDARWRLTATRSERQVAGGFVGVGGAMITVTALVHLDIAVAVLALAITSTLVWLISRIDRSPRRSS